MHRPIAFTLLSLVTVAAVAVIAPAAAFADRAYTTRFGAVDRGDIAIVANTSMSCPTGAAGCAEGRAGDPTIRNSSFTMTHVDVDSDPTTFNSSRADLRLPAGATVLFAGLYWGSDTKAGAGGVDAPNPAAKGTVRLATGSGYEAVTATQIDTSRVFPTRYQGFADVTDRVRAAGSGTYTVANVQAATGSDNFGGWGLFVVYRDPALPVRWLGLYDGFRQFVDNDVFETSLSGFRPPADGTVDASFGLLVYEGDLGVTGDVMEINGRDLTDALHSGDNFFNSRITWYGEYVTAKDPDFVNQMGHGTSMVDIDGFLGNDTTSAAIRMGVSSDHLQTGPMSLVVEHSTAPPANIAAPSISGTASEGQTLTASTGTWTGDPSFTYRWRRCDSVCTDIADAAGPTLTLGGQDAGKAIRVQVTATNQFGSTSAESAATTPVLAAPRTDPPPTTDPPPGGDHRSRGTQPPPCGGALIGTYTRGRTGTLRLRLELQRPVTDVEFAIPATMLPTRRAAGKRSVGHLRVAGSGRPPRSLKLRFRRVTKLVLTMRRNSRVRLIRTGARVERIPRHVRRIDLTLTTRSPAPPHGDKTIEALFRTPRGNLQRVACVVTERG